MQSCKSFCWRKSLPILWEGLTYPSNMCFIVTQYVYLMFNVRIYSMEEVHQKQQFSELLNNSLPIMRNVKKSWLFVTEHWTCSRRIGYFRYKSICLCYVMKNLNKSLFYIWPILKAISCLANANVLLCNYVGLQVMILQKDWGSYLNLIHVWTYIIEYYCRRST